MLRHLGLTHGLGGSIAEGARVVRQFLIDAGIDKDDFVFFDGSGLSGHDLVTPRATARLLQYASGQPWFADWKASLPVGGVDGSLEARFAKAPLKGRVFAKTGNAGRGAGFEWICGLCEWAHCDLFDHGWESSAADECGSRGDGQDRGGDCGGELMRSRRMRE